MRKSIRIISLNLASTILLASCSSTTMIQSNPPQAKVYLDGAYVGETPYSHRDSKIVGSSMTVKIEKEGYKPVITSISKDEEADVGAIIGGCFVAIPFLWCMKYSPVHTYQLQSLTVGSEQQTSNEPQKVKNSIKSKAERLRELKQLLDEKIITQEEFEKEKAKILEEHE